MKNDLMSNKDLEELNIVVKSCIKLSQCCSHDHHVCISHQSEEKLNRKHDYSNG